MKSVFDTERNKAMKNNRFECCFENYYKGIYFEIEDNANYVSIVMFNMFEVETEVCLRKDEVQRLIYLLQDTIKH